MGDDVRIETDFEKSRVPLFRLCNCCFQILAHVVSPVIAATPLVALMGTLLHSTVPLSTGIFIYF
jgi:hypothetical protein